MHYMLRRTLKTEGALGVSHVCIRLPDVAREPVMFGVLFFVGLKVSSETGKTEEWIKWRRRRTLVCRRAEDKGQYGLRANYSFLDILLYQQLCAESEGKKSTWSVWVKILHCILDFCIQNIYVFFLHVQNPVSSTQWSRELNRKDEHESNKHITVCIGHVESVFFVFWFLSICKGFFSPPSKNLTSYLFRHLSHYIFHTLRYIVSYRIMQLFPHLGKYCAVNSAHATRLGILSGGWWFCVLYLLFSSGREECVEAAVKSRSILESSSRKKLCGFWSWLLKSSPSDLHYMALIVWINSKWCKAR